jgi:hypothetical protein
MGAGLLPARPSAHKFFLYNGGDNGAVDKLCVIIIGLTEPASDDVGLSFIARTGPLVGVSLK